MGTDVQKFFGGHQLPSKEKMAEALAGFAASKSALGGKPLLKFTKDSGQWVFGISNEALPHGTRLIVNPASLSSGFIAWWLGQIEGEIMQPLTMGPVDPNKLGPVNSGGIPPGQKKPSGQGWQPQSSVEMITEDKVPLQMVYKTSSIGGLRCLMDLASDIVYGQSENPARVYPVVELQGDSYPHKEFGTVHTPILAVVGWLDEQGKPVSDTAQLMDKGRGLV